ncbi:Zn-dependent alcohol dehydrogenase [Luteimicrobium album]|uniref:Zn-dependent alcohol dehydrogenase n=1 Tax=Luteimicrobium album TaxID=1054550 RepID=A0ABQ6I1E2_9MICO|nr:zinc-binding dehydrogenase [Luteimicrobium album]GMA24432.1 Zn-dependent alcohol dehydrogenase [Luteimicrobium album]
MRALVKYDLSDEGMEVRDIPEPSMGDDEVLIETRAVGVCGSDIHLWRNSHSWDLELPVVVGHEIAGEVIAVGPGAPGGWRVGDRVVCETAAKICGRCRYCRTGQYNLCPDRLGYGAKHDGFFTARVAVEPRVLHRIPDGVSYEHAALAEPFAVAYNALVERATVVPGDLVVIQGAGPIGALSVQVARLCGAGRIVVLCTDRDEPRLPSVVRMGADQVVNVQKEDARVIVGSLGDGLGADVVVDATGVSAALADSLDLVRALGTVVKIGWGPQPYGRSLDPLVAKAVTLHGSFSHTWTTWERVLDGFATGRLDASAALGGVYPLDDWAQAFEDMESGRNVKSVLTFSVARPAEEGEGV